MRHALLLALALSACAREELDPHDTATTPGGPTPEAPWPEWAFHHWVWEDESTQESALAFVQGFLDRDIPVGALIIDSPWATGYSTFEWDPERFPDPQAMIDELHGEGVRVMLWTVPGINVDTQPLYDEAAAAGYFMRANEQATEPAVVSWWKGDGSLVDYFNPEAVTWWHGLVDGTLDYGIDGWKCDGLDFAAVTASYSPGAGEQVSRLDYSHAYYRDFFEYTRAELGDDRIITARPVDNYGADLGGDGVAFAPVDVNWAGWVGDQDGTFLGKEMALKNMYYSAEYGYVAFGSDIGGYREDPDADPALGRTKELFLRWTQLGALNPVMENGGGGEHRPWMFDEETVEIYRTWVELHHALLPYLMAEGAVAFDEGRSVMTFLGAQGDYRYLLGADVFVDPILTPGTTHAVELPDEGEWVWVHDGQAYAAGATATLEVPLEAYPVFVRRGSEAEALLAGFGAL